MATRIDGRARDERIPPGRLRGRSKSSPRLTPVDAAGHVDQRSFIDAETLGLASRMYALRRRRDENFSADLFSEPAWDILLHLYVEAGERRVVSVSSACEGAAAPATTALRKLRQLEDGGWILREGDPSDARRSYVRLSPRAVEQLRELLRGACSRHENENE